MFQLFYRGGGMYGKLGHGNEAGHSTPRRVEALVGLAISQIACGSRHTAALTTTGALYTWGDKENGVAGHGEEGHQYTPKLLESDRLGGKKIIQLSACGFHTGCITDDGEVYTWGEGKFGRLGHGNERNCYYPKLVEWLLGKRPKEIACGGFHTAVVTEDGRLYTFGGGEHGQLGHGDKVNKTKPTLVAAMEDVFVTQITCGWSHSVALSNKGRVYTWGNSDHGKLGHGNQRKLSTPCLLEKLSGYQVVWVASYNEHTAALVEPIEMGCMGSNSVPVTSSYVQDMKDMINQEEYSDVTFIIENQKIFAHRSILAARCDHFSAMFSSGMRESIEREIHINNMSDTVFLLLLEYLYTDHVHVDVGYAVELYIAADIYRLDRLRDMCCTVVKRNVNPENATILLQNSDNAGCQVLKDICMEFIVSNFDIISKGDGIKCVSHALLLEILSNRP
jgi:RCC1 and BTB domain-containing protein